MNKTFLWCLFIWALFNGYPYVAAVLAYVVLTIDEG